MTKELRLVKVLQQLQILADAEVSDNEIDDNLPEENGDVSDYEVFEDKSAMVTAATNAKVETFLTVFSSILTQYDQMLSAKEMVRGGRGNIYRLGHYLNGLDKIRTDVSDILQDDSKEAAERLLAAISEGFTEGNPGDKLRKVVRAYIDSGKLPNVPVSKK